MHSTVHGYWIQYVCLQCVYIFFHFLLNICIIICHKTYFIVLLLTVWVIERVTYMHTCTHSHTNNGNEKKKQKHERKEIMVFVLHVCVSLYFTLCVCVCEYCMRTKSMGIFCAIVYGWIVAVVVVILRCHLFQSFCEFFFVSTASDLLCTVFMLKLFGCALCCLCTNCENGRGKRAFMHIPLFIFSMQTYTHTFGLTN